MSPAPDCEPQGVRIVPNPGVEGSVIVHLPEIDYVDTQVWSADIGISVDALRELRDASDQHLGSDAAKRVAALHEPVQHMGRTWCSECSVRRSTGPRIDEWVALIPHPCPTLDALNSTEATA
jgi:hypothetical protein